MTISCDLSGRYSRGAPTGTGDTSGEQNSSPLITSNSASCLSVSIESSRIIIFIVAAVAAAVVEGDRICVNLLPNKGGGWNPRLFSTTRDSQHSDIFPFEILLEQEQRRKKKIKPNGPTKPTGCQPLLDSPLMWALFFVFEFSLELSLGLSSLAAQVGARSIVDPG